MFFIVDSICQFRVISMNKQEIKMIRMKTLKNVEKYSDAYDEIMNTEKAILNSIV